DGRALSYAAESFDLLLAHVVFSSILDPEIARAVAREMARVLRPGGAVVWYDNRYPNPWNRHVRSYGRRELRQLFPGFEVSIQTLTLIPQLARFVGRRAPRLLPLLSRIPPLRARYLAILRRPVGCHRERQ